MTSNFNKDIKIGNAGELILVDYLRKINVLSQYELCNTYKYDILITDGKYKGVTFEVKYDQYPDTNNMILELLCLNRLKFTGVLSTQAKYFCYIFKHNKTGYIIKVSSLLSLLKGLDKGLVTNGGDNNNSVMVKLPYKKLLSKFHKFNYE